MIKNNPHHNPSPFHGYVISPQSRSQYLVSQGKLGESWPVNEMEGGKNFPNILGGQFAKQGNERAFYDDYESAVPPVDGLILSGGRTENNREMVNYTDQELLTNAGISGGWPKLSVASGSTFHVNWSFQAGHKTRGYRWYITKQDWNPNERLTRNAFETAPIYSEFHPYTPYWSYNDTTMAPWKNHSVVLPSRTGHQVLLLVWVIANTGMGFYQAFDLDFSGSGGETDGGETDGGETDGGETDGGGNYPQWSIGVNYNVDDRVMYMGSVYRCIQAHQSNAGWSPTVAFVLWSLVS